MLNRLAAQVLSLFLLSVTVFVSLNGSPSIALAAPAGKGVPETARLNVGLPQSVLSFLPLWAADDKGLFRDEGLEVKIIAFRGDTEAVQALAGGTIDLNVSAMNGLISAISSGQKIKSFWAGYNMPFFEWYSQPKFKSIAETKGGRYAISKFGGLSDSLTRYVLRKAGLNPEKDVTILQLGGPVQFLAALEAGQVDVAVLTSPFTQMASEKGFTRLMSQKEHIAQDWPTHVVYAKEEFISKNPNTIKAFLRASGKAMEWVKSNPDEAAKVANKNLKFKVDYCRRAIDEMRDGWYADGRLPGKGLKIFWDIAVEAGDVKEPWPNNRWLDESFIKTQNEWRK